ncbi:MAG: PAS domain-containing protein [Desulfamplus sp.]|nr:PAS domain-containing protein [Desulfamplus sp.]
MSWHKKKRKKIIWHIFPPFLIITFISLTAVTWYATTFFKDFSLKNTERELIIQGELIKRDILARYGDNVNDLCREIGSLTHKRITVILPSGEVIGDSVSEISAMENHRHRYEIAQAFEFGKGVAVRHSETLDKNMMYAALRVVPQAHGPYPAILDYPLIEMPWVLRVSVSIESIENEIRHIQKNMGIALLIALLAAAGASLIAARRITRPIELMKVGARQFAEGNLKARLIIPDSSELFQLGITMNQMAAALGEKIKTIENRSMELEAIHSSMKEGVIAIDLDENIITANHAAAMIFNHPPSMIRGKNVIEIARFYELQEFIKKALADPEPLEDDIVIRKSEDYIYNVTSTALCNTKEERLGTLIIFHDITRIRHLEKMHRDFAANVSHELKTPLTSIKGFVETLVELMENGASPSEIKFLTIIEKNVNRLISLIDDLLALSRLELEDGADALLEAHCLATVVESAVETCSPLMERDGIDIVMECNLETKALVEPVLMEQALVNLIENAIKYSKSGDDIRVICKEEQGRVVIEVQDFGVGIPEVHLSKIFHRFYRVDKARSRDMGGTGLGLAIVKHIVKYHQGSITVSSVPGEGSTFKIILPSIDISQNGNEGHPPRRRSNRVIQINSVQINRS